MDAKDILARAKPQTVEVTVKELDGTLHIKRLSAREALGIQLTDGEEPSVEWMAKAIGLGVVNPDGSPMFDAAAVELLPDLPFSDLQAMLSAIMDVNGLGQSNVEEAPGN